MVSSAPAVRVGALHVTTWTNEDGDWGPQLAAWKAAHCRYDPQDKSWRVSYVATPGLDPSELGARLTALLGTAAAHGARVEVKLDTMPAPA